jgi:hypothetical protein
MKKVLFLISILAVFAQINFAQTVNYAMPAGSSYMSVATDYTITNTTARNFIFLAPQDYAATQDYLIQLDSVSGNHTNVAVALYGAKFASTAYSQIGSTVNYRGTGAGASNDTTIVISNASANRYRIYKVTVTGTGTGVSKVSAQEFKLYNQ